MGDAEDVVEAEVALAAFDLADVRPVQGGALGQLLLGQAQLLAAGAHTPAELTSGWRERRLAVGGHGSISTGRRLPIQRLCISGRCLLRLSVAFRAGEEVDEMNGGS